MCVSRVLGGPRNKNYSCFFPSRDNGCHGCCSGASRVLAAYSLDVTYSIDSLCVGDELYQKGGITHTVQPDLRGGRGNMAHHR